ncbi:hypothetical protein Tco_1148234 [Tanacetum coccineum]
MGFKYLVGRLKAYEERVKEEDKANNAQEKLLYAMIDNSNRNNDSSGGRGRGSYSRGRDRGQARGQGNSQNQGQRDTRITMKIINKRTQEGDDVWYFDNGEVNLTEEKCAPPKIESNTEEDDVWYFDNGESNHVTSNYSYFSELNENITGRVRFGDGSCMSDDIK